MPKNVFYLPTWLTVWQIQNSRSDWIQFKIIFPKNFVALLYELLSANVADANWFLLQCSLLDLPVCFTLKAFRVFTLSWPFWIWLDDSYVLIFFFFFPHTVQHLKSLVKLKTCTFHQLLLVPSQLKQKQTYIV